MKYCLTKISKIKVLLCTFCIIVGSISNNSYAQKQQQKEDFTSQKWNLDDCINYAKAQNIKLQQKQLNYNSSQVDLKTAKAAILPSVQASIGENYSDNYFNNNSSTKNNYNGSYSISANWNLFKGGLIKNNIKLAKVNEQISQLQLEQYSNEIQVSITQYYIQILYSIENVKINEQTVEVSLKQLNRAKELLNVGSISKSDYAQMDAQYSSDKYNLVVSQSILEENILNLKQLLELPPESNFEIVTPDIDEKKILEVIPSKLDVYRNALELRPEINIEKLNENSSQLNLKIAKSGYLPTVSLSASSGTSNMSGSNYSFGTQLKNAWTNSIGLNVSIPIFSNRNNKSNVEKAENNIKYSQLELQNTQKELYQTIENLYLEAKNAQEKFISAKEQYKSAQVSYELLNEQFDLGMKNIVDLVQGKNTFLTSEQQMLQSKYMALYNLQILKFYNGEPICL